jgi:hypothetical protein
MRKGIVLALAFDALLACQDDPTRPPPEGVGSSPPGSGIGGGGSRTSDASTEAGTDAGVCTTLDIGGAQVDQQGILGDPPAGSGGAIVDGTYDMVEARLYVGDAGTPGVTGNRFQASLRVTGGTVERSVIFTGNAGGSARSFVRGTLTRTTPTDPNGTYAIACPKEAQESLAISVLNSGANLTLTNQVTKEAFVWSKRP